MFKMCSNGEDPLHLCARETIILACVTQVADLFSLLALGGKCFNLMVQAHDFRAGIYVHFMCLYLEQGVFPNCEMITPVVVGCTISGTSR